MHDMTADLMLKNSTNTTLEMQLKTTQEINFSKQ